MGGWFPVADVAVVGWQTLSPKGAGPFGMAMDLCRYNPTPLLVRLDGEVAGTAWCPLRALGLAGTCSAEDVLLWFDRDPDALFRFRQMVTTAYFVVSRGCRGRTAKSWCRNKAIPLGALPDALEAAQSARACLMDDVGLLTVFRYLENQGHSATGIFDGAGSTSVASGSDNDGSAVEEALTAALSRAHRHESEQENQHGAESYMIELSTELEFEKATGAGLVIERAVYGDIGTPLNITSGRAEAASVAMWMRAGSAFAHRSENHAVPAGTKPLLSTLNAALDAGCATDVTEAMQRAVAASWDSALGGRSVSLFFPVGSKARLAGFYNPCPTLEASHPRRGLLVRYRFAGSVHVSVGQDCEPLRMPLRSHSAAALIKKWPKSCFRLIVGPSGLSPCPRPCPLRDGDPRPGNPAPASRLADAESKANSASGTASKKKGQGRGPSMQRASIATVRSQRMGRKITTVLLPDDTGTQVVVTSPVHAAISLAVAGQQRHSGPDAALPRLARTSTRFWPATVALLSGIMLVLGTSAAVLAMSPSSRKAATTWVRNTAASLWRSPVCQAFVAPMSSAPSAGADRNAVTLALADIEVAARQ